MLTPQEADQLFVMLERLRERGQADPLHHHQLEEVKRLCDTATILRHGKVVATLQSARRKRPRRWRA